ncbi:glycosyltransferase [Ornithinimicrobium sp. Y1847]|uniref:glycosyltransferase n=1 Tax=Ornithinimicrobium sp. Y1847 TaxID=3405419 RepID=UPI003B66FD39
MQSRRFVLVGTRVVGGEVTALLGAAVGAGLDVRAGAQQPPQGSADWHRFADPRAGSGLGGLLGSWAGRALRGAAAQFADHLGGDRWLLQQVIGRGASGAPADEDEVLVVAVDDIAAQAVARWRASDPGSAAAAVRVLTWDQGAEALVVEIAAARRAEGDAAGESAPRSTEGASGSVGEDRPLGARHALTVVPAPGTTVRTEVRAALDLARTVLTVPDDDARWLQEPVDAVILDGLGPAVLDLTALPAATPVLHLVRPTDRRSPWRHLLDPALVDVVLQPDQLDQALGAAVGEPAVSLIRLAADEGDEAALARARELLAQVGRECSAEHSEPDATQHAVSAPAPAHEAALLREISFLARVTGSLTLEGDVLAQQADQRRALGLPASERIHTALRRVTTLLTETEPGWLPTATRSVAPTLASEGQYGQPRPIDGQPGDPIPGKVLHILKVVLPQRQAGYSVRGHQSLRALVEAGVDVVAVAAPTSPSGPAHPPGAAHPPAPQIEEVVLDGVRYLIPTLPEPTAGQPAEEEASEHAEEGTAYLEAQASVLLEVIRQERPALLHVHSGGRGYDLGVVGAAVARAAGLPWIYEMRGFFESLWTRQLKRAERGELFTRRMAKEAELAGLADGVVTLAETMRADLLRRVEDSADLDIRVVPNAVDPEALGPRPRDDALASRWGTQGHFTFGYVSNLDHAREQIEDLLRAVVILKDLGINARVLIVGDGARRARLEETARTYGAEGLSIFTGAVPHAEVAAAYGLLDVLVVPRSDERAARLVTPLKPYEAMAMGVPVVVSAQPALLEIIGDGERGWSYPAGDAPALARLLLELARDPARRSAIAARAREWVTIERTWAANATRYQELYATVVDSTTR